MRGIVLNALTLPSVHKFEFVPRRPRPQTARKGKIGRSIPPRPAIHRRPPASRTFASFGAAAMARSPSVERAGVPSDGF